MNDKLFKDPSRQTVVIKYGGNAMTDPALKEQVAEDIVALTKKGVRVVLVHGGGPEISELMEKLGKKPEFVNGLRVTDKETVDIVLMVLAGKVNKTLVSLLDKKGGRAIGISGLDAQLIKAQIKDERLGYVGRITDVDATLITDLLEKGYIPVISTVAGDSDGNIYNINGDTAAAYIAGALGADRLVMMTDIAGILTDRDDASTLISSITVGQAKELCENGVVNGGMIPKVECCITAIEAGVKTVSIIDGRVPHSVLAEISSKVSIGTLVKGE